MGNGPQKWTEELIAKRIRDGRGQGDGDAYSPWLFVQEFSSKGTQTRVTPSKINRIVHTFSYIELALFYWLEYLTNFAGYKEQFPMDRAVTLGAAKGLRIRHPTYRKTGVPVVMTIDAIATHTDSTGRLIDVAWDAKPSSYTRDQRVLEKLSLHKAFCHHVGLQHRVFTDLSVPKNVIENIAWARSSTEVEGEIAMGTCGLDEHAECMLSELRRNGSRKTIRSFCNRYDTTHRLFPGSGLRIFRNLVWRRLVNVNLNVPHITAEPTPIPVEEKITFSARRVA